MPFKVGNIVLAHFILKFIHLSTSDLYEVAGILYRDTKSGNILIIKEDDTTVSRGF